MAEVIIYSSDHCPFCLNAKQLLARKGVPYTEINVENDEQKRSEMISKSGGLRTVPQIFINGQHIGGYLDLYALEQQGLLDKLLND